MVGVDTVDNSEVTLFHVVEGAWVVHTRLGVGAVTGREATARSDRRTLGGSGPS